MSPLLCVHLAPPRGLNLKTLQRTSQRRLPGLSNSATLTCVASVYKSGKRPHMATMPCHVRRVGQTWLSFLSDKGKARIPPLGLAGTGNQVEPCFHPVYNPSSCVQKFTFTCPRKNGNKILLLPPKRAATVPHTCWCGWYGQILQGLREKYKHP